MNIHKQGFTIPVIPTVLSLLLVTGVSITAISIHNNKPESKEIAQVQDQEVLPEQPKEESIIAKDQIVATSSAKVKADSTAVQPRVETSIQSPIQVAVKDVPAVVAQTVAIGDKIDPESEVVQICKDVVTINHSEDRDTNTLIESVKNRCNKIQTKGLFYDPRNMFQEQLKFDWKSIDQNKMPKGPAIIEVTVNQPQVTEVKAEVPTESYKESSTYPTIIAFTDNHGNLVKRSDYNGYEGPYANMERIELKVGDVIRATVEAKDPQGRTLEYNWSSNSMPFEDAIGIEKGKYKYTSNNHLEYTLTDADLKSTGEKFRLVYQVRVKGTDRYRFGGGEYDDVGFVDYQLAQ